MRITSSAVYNRLMLFVLVSNLAPPLGLRASTRTGDGAAPSPPALWVLFS